MIDQLRINKILDVQCPLYISDRQMEKPDIKKFAKLLREKIDASDFDTDTAFAKASKTSKQNVSRIVRLQKHPITQAIPSVERETVIKWASTLNWDLNEALTLAGHAAETATQPKKPTTVVEFFEILESLGLDVQMAGGFKTLEGLGSEDLEDLLDTIKANALVKIQKKGKAAAAKLLKL